MGAIATVSIKRQWVAEGKRWVEADITGTTSYATGGDTCTAALFGLNEVNSLYLEQSNVTFDGVNVITGTGNETGTIHLDNTTAGLTPKSFKLLRYVNGAQIANATNWSTITQRVVAVGS